jgi:hypothetical protein
MLRIYEGAGTEIITAALNAVGGDRDECMKGEGKSVFSGSPCLKVGETWTNW